LILGSFTKICSNIFTIFFNWIAIMDILFEDLVTL
jgi:hypothetical protein